MICRMLHLETSLVHFKIQNTFLAVVPDIENLMRQCLVWNGGMQNRGKEESAGIENYC